MVLAGMLMIRAAARRVREAADVQR
jgi:hypothetical protein